MKYISEEDLLDMLYVSEVNTGSFSDLRQKIKSHPGAKVKPVKMGKWNWNRCTNCGRQALWEVYYGIDGEESCVVHSKFCPHCGIVMENHD